MAQTAVHSKLPHYLERFERVGTRSLRIPFQIGKQDATANASIDAQGLSGW